MGLDANGRADIAVAICAGAGILAYMFWKLRKQVASAQAKDQQAAKSTLRELGLTQPLALSVHEARLVADCLVLPSDLTEASEVYGLGDTVTDMELKLLRPLALPTLYSKGLWRMPKGVLLHGPPGTGKTSLAKAIAAKGHFRFIHLSVASISNMWVGEGSKLARAAFTLARKLAPCIVFVDEVDALLSRRGGDIGGGGTHQAYEEVKTVFMSEWDGLLSEAQQKRVVIMGATNRRGALDPAVLRRFTLQYEVPLPQLQQRKEILSEYLGKHAARLSPELWPASVAAAAAGSRAAAAAAVGFPAAGQLAAPAAAGSALEWLAAATERFSGADLSELCHRAALRVLDEEDVTRLGDIEVELRLQQQPAASETRRKAASSTTHTLPRHLGCASDGLHRLRPLGRQDFEAVLPLVRPLAG